MQVTIATSPSNRQNPNPHRGNPDCKTIDWANSSDRKWLVNHLHWAMNNNYEVRLVPIHN